MDELELLKKDWKKGTETFKNYSDSDIYPMLHKKIIVYCKNLILHQCCRACVLGTY